MSKTATPAVSLIATPDTGPITTPVPTRSTYRPRPYQRECIQALAQARADGATAGLVEMASGLGKTVTVILDAEQYLAEYPNARFLYVCDQEPILTQSMEKFHRHFGGSRSYGLFTGEEKTFHRVDFLFATFQSLAKYPEAFAADAFAYIVNDEAHHAMATTYKPTLQYFQPQFLLGLTATPDRTDGCDILEIYQRVIFRMTIYDGWMQGWLARVDYRLMLDEFNEDELKQYIELVDGEGMKVSIGQLNRTIFAPKRDEEIVAAIRAQTSDIPDPRICIYCPSIAHAEAITELFGGEAALVHSEQDSRLNHAVLNAFCAGDIRILVSIDMLNEGYDVPQANVVVFLRATESLRIFLQQLGRGLRLIEGKDVVRVLDFVVNIERISMVLEMERQVKERVPTTPTDTSVPVDPFLLNIRATKFRMERADIEKLLRRIGGPQRGSFRCEEELFAAARAYAAELGHPDYLTTTEIDANKAFPCWETLRQTYNTLGNFLLLAGMTQRRRTRKIFKTKRAIRKALANKIKQLGGKSPTRRQVDEDDDMPSVKEILKFYPTYNDALLDAGATKLNSEKGANDKYPDEAMKAEAHAMKEALGHTPTGQEWDDNPRTCSTSVLEKRHGSYNKAMIAYGLSPNKRHIALNSPRKIHGVIDGDGLTEEAVLRLQAIVHRTGRSIKPSDLCAENGVPNASYFYQHGWMIADINRYIKAETIVAAVSKYEPMEPAVMEQLRECVQSKRRPLLWSDMGKRKNGMPALSYFRKHGIVTIDMLNAIVGTNEILAKLENN